MVDQGYLICWNCSKRSPPGNCIHCDVPLSDPDEAFVEKEPEPPKKVLEIRRKDEENIRIEFEEVVNLVQNNFKIKKMVLSSEPQFVVEHPGTGLSDQFDNLLEQSEAMVAGFKPKLESIGDSSELVIKYLYTEPPGPTEYRSVFLLGIVSLVSVFLAAMFNYTQIQNALGTKQSGIAIFGVYINGSALLSSLIFTLTLVGIIMIKDTIQIRSMISEKKKQIIPFYIPAPPIFELGTLGSVYKQDHIHKTKKEMFNTTYYGPVIAWILSCVIILVTLPMATYDPTAAERYSSHSIVANGKVEPLVFTLLAHLGNAIGLTNIDLSQPITQSYIFHPITIGALAGFYIVTFSLLPAVHFNGGFIVRSILGSRIHWLMTYAVIIGIAFIPGAWPLAILLFFINELLKTPEILNQESPKPKGAELLLIPYFIIIIISFPMHLEFLQTFLGFLFQ